MALGRENKKEEYQGFKLEIKGEADTLSLCNVIPCDPYSITSMPGRKMATVHNNNYLSIWDVESGVEMSNTRVHLPNPDIFVTPNGGILCRDGITPNQVLLFDPNNKIHQHVDNLILLNLNCTTIVNQQHLVCHNEDDVYKINIYDINDFNKPVTKLKIPTPSRCTFSFASLGNKLILTYYYNHIEVLDKINNTYKLTSTFKAPDYDCPLIYGLNSEEFVMFNNQSFNPLVSIWQTDSKNSYKKMKENKAEYDSYSFIPFHRNAKAFFTCKDLKYNNISEVQLWDAEELKPYKIDFKKNIKLITPISAYQFAVSFKDSPSIAIYQSHFLWERYKQHIATAKAFITHEILTTVKTIDPDSTGIIAEYYADESEDIPPLVQNHATFFKHKRTIKNNIRTIQSLQPEQKTTCFSDKMVF